MSDNDDKVKEFIKTGVFLVVALIVGVAAALLRPVSISTPRELPGTKVFPDFTDAAQATSLKIVRFDDAIKATSSLEIANVEGRWVVVSDSESNNGYPADANDSEERIRSVAINLMDLEVVDVASDQNSDHVEYGVVDPESVSEGDVEEGTGLLVAMENESGEPLARLIIGKEVRGHLGQRFVRRPNQHRVYVVKIDPEQLSSRFEDWIEGDLLKLKDPDIEQIILKDYTFNRQLAITPDGKIVPIPQYERRLEVTVGWNATDYKWSLKEFLQNQQGRLVSSQLMENEELNTTKLDALKKALTELKIVDVRSKPEGLSADLKAEKLLFDDPEAGQSLIDRGFFPVEVAPQQIEILSSDGEVRVGTSEGVEYILRFGNTAGIEERQDQTDMMRFLMVSARVNEAAIPLPDMEPLPKKPVADGDAPQPPDAKDESDDGEGSEEATEPKPNAADDSEAKDDAEDQPTDPEPNEADKAFEAELQRVQKENQRKLDEYNEKRRNAVEKVKDLNGRFADWYYVISEDVYKKIHLGRFDLIKEKEGQEATGVDAFRKLETDGLIKDPALNLN